MSPVSLGRAVFGAVLLVLLLATHDAVAAPPHVRRIAIVIGANEPPPGRSPLRFAQDDAKRMGAVFQSVGRFLPGDVHVLLDPRPAEIIQTLDAIARTARSEETLFVFYYSGHSDGQAVYPHGEAMQLTDLRERIARIGAQVRVGILDTCRGGSWTQAKGLSVGPPLDPVDLVTLGSEGTALVSSSSGFENAHEADAVQGSFFTHHLAAGLLGAADRSGDGQITLQEAFDYAKELTVRDSARMAPTTQHPSFDLQLRGRQDIVLAQLASSPSALEISQVQGPLEIIHLASGIAVVEVSAGERHVRLALPPGRYLVRKVANGKTYAKELVIPAGSSVAFAEGQLEVVANERLALKGGAEPSPLPFGEMTTLPHRWWELRLAAGVSTGPGRMWSAGTFVSSNPSDLSVRRTFAANFGLTYAFSDRFQWAVPVPAFAYRFGEPGRLEIVPRLGLTSLGYSSVEGAIGTLDAGVALRAWTSSHHSLVATVRGGHGFSASSEHVPATSTWSGATTLGTMLTIQNAVSLHLGAGIEGEVGHTGASTVDRATTVVFGSVQSIGYRSFPLLAVHLSPKFSLDAHASWAVNVRTGDVRDRYLGGFTWSF